MNTPSQITIPYELYWTLVQGVNAAHTITQQRIHELEHQFIEHNKLYNANTTLINELSTKLEEKSKRVQELIDVADTNRNDYLKEHELNGRLESENHSLKVECKEKEKRIYAQMILLADNKKDMMRLNSDISRQGDELAKRNRQAQ